jgi:RNA polymerase sigma-70 factor (ECF subfamily)
MRSSSNAPASDAAAQADELELLERLRRGDRAAFTALVERHGGALQRLALTFVHSRAVAEEVVQDTWLAALGGLAAFEGRASLRRWLFSILANRARTRAVREGRSLPFSALGPAGAEADPAVPPERFDQGGAWRGAPAAWTEEDPERLALRAETGAALEAAIAALPPAQRAVITLRDVEGLETEAICELLGLTVTNQRVLLHRARTAVRLALGRHLAAEG